MTILPLVSPSIMAYRLFQMLATGDMRWALASFLIGNPLIQASIHGPLAAFMPEMFGTTSRYTGALLGFQLASTLLTMGNGNPMRVSVMVSLIWVISVLAIFLTKESHKLDLDGDQPEPAAPATGSEAVHAG